MFVVIKDLVEGTIMIAVKDIVEVYELDGDMNIRTAHSSYRLSMEEGSRLIALLDGYGLILVEGEIIRDSDYFDLDDFV